MIRVRSLVLLVLVGCAGKLKVDPVKIEPIHMTIDVNVHDDESPKNPDPTGAR